MRITIIGGPFQPWPPAPCGSVERIWHGLAVEFARAGHKVTAICQRHPSQAREETVDGVHYLRTWRFSRTKQIRRDLLLDMIFSLRVLPLMLRGDIVVPHTFWLPVLLPRLGQWAGKVVAHVQRFPKGQMYLYLKTACITTVSQAIADGIAEQCPRARSLIRIVPNPIHTSVFVPPSPPRVYDGKGVIVYTGRVHPEKGLDLLVNAYRMIQPRWPGVRLKIIGPAEVSRGGGGEEFVNHLRSLAGAAPVEFLPSIDRLDVLAQTLREAHWYCYPSAAEKGEASPVAPLEAMAVGLAPVVSDIPQFRGYLMPGRNGLVFDHRAADPSRALAQRLEQLISDPQLCIRLGSDAHQTAVEFSYPAIARQYLALFEQLIPPDTP